MPRDNDSPAWRNDLVELMRCFRQHLLDLVVMGYQFFSEQASTEGRSLEEYAADIQYPLVLLGWTDLGASYSTRRPLKCWINWRWPRGVTSLSSLL